MIFEIILLLYVGISFLFIAIFFLLIDSSPIGTQDENGFHLLENKENR